MKLVLMLRGRDDAIMKLDADFPDIEFRRANFADDLRGVVEDCEILVASGSFLAYPVNTLTHNM